MPLSLRYFIVVIVILSSTLSDSNAQRRRKPKIWEGFSVTGRVGANHFYGDLVDDGRTNYSFGVVGEKELNTFLSGRLSLMGGKMSGSQHAYSDGDDIDFEGDVYAWFDNTYVEMNAGASFRPLNLLLGYYKQRAFNPYVIGQVGILYYSASEYFGARNDQGEEDGAHWRDKSGITASISGGLGLSYWINSQWSVNIEAIGTFPTTDELDAHSEWTSPDGTVYQTEANDFYYTTSIGLTFLIDDSRWKNEPKYNRKAYLKTRSQYKSSSKKNLKSINKKRRKRR
ncbi:outer membrane beta-barrel protein [Carboxylicivirga sp. M1479]|uniref:outer membrane beta-barrel protein n=1 Tax=Carboxylicivirga sp. M1479 TaxID=2594476 RepID=UPI001178BD11|nr:outer membrane beta-barrel protein [Carboxylicivirga sp. M1479]TRX70291.1 hypothetical protein FNN09_12470 [Carboxylicivirga sp. M1479]